MKLGGSDRRNRSAAKMSKEVCMIDLLSGKVLRRFSSQHEAVKWLVKNGKAKKAFGYDWRFAGEEYELKTQLAFSDLDS